MRCSPRGRGRVLPGSAVAAGEVGCATGQPPGCWYGGVKPQPAGRSAPGWSCSPCPAWADRPARWLLRAELSGGRGVPSVDKSTQLQGEKSGKAQTQRHSRGFQCRLGMFTCSWLAPVTTSRTTRSPAGTPSSLGALLRAGSWGRSCSGEKSSCGLGGPCSCRDSLRAKPSFLAHSPDTCRSRRGVLALVTHPPARLGTAVTPRGLGQQHTVLFRSCCGSGNSSPQLGFGETREGGFLGCYSPA